MTRWALSSLARLSLLAFGFSLMPVGCRAWPQAEQVIFEAPAPLPLLPTVSSSAIVTLNQSIAPQGGVVKRLNLPNPEVEVLVRCQPADFSPVGFQVSGLHWLGCRGPNFQPVPDVASPREPILTEVQRPSGEIVPQVTLVTPQSVLVVTCGEQWQPYVYESQGTWVSCQSPTGAPRIQSELGGRHVHPKG